MRAYILITGVAFTLLLLAHIARLFAEGTGPLGNPIFIATTLASAVLAAWAARLLLRSRPTRA